MKNVRRSDREISGQEARDILLAGEYGVLSTVGSDGQPYGVPVNYVFKDDSIYFHSAVEGHKLENIEDNPKVSFCVVGKTKLLPAQFGTEYESAVAFGVASEVGGAERQDALLMLLEKYCEGYVEEGKQAIAANSAAMKVFKVKIEHLTGKARR